METFISVFKRPEAEALFMKAYDRLLSAWPAGFEEKYISTSLGNTHVIISGDSRQPFLFLFHAFYTTALSWHKNVAALSRYFRVVAIDMIGDPNKSKPFRPVRKDMDYVNWIAGIMNDFNVSQAYLAGNSAGGFHAANFALYHPEKVKKLILIGPAAVFYQIPAFYLHAFPAGLTGWDFMIGHTVHWMENGVPFEDEWKDVFCLSLKYGKGLAQVFPRVLTVEELGKLTMPVMLIYGDRERIYNVKRAIQRARECISDIQIEVIPRANHLTALSNPELTNNAMIRFLRDNES